MSRFVDNRHGCPTIRDADHCCGMACQRCAQNEGCWSCEAVVDLVVVAGGVRVPVQN